MATRQKRVTESAIKRRRASESRKTRQKTVNLRDQFLRWQEISEENGCRHDGEVAKILIDCYHIHKKIKEPEQKRRKTSTPATVHRKLLPAEMSASSISAFESERESIISGFEEIEQSPISESLRRGKSVGKGKKNISRKRESTEELHQKAISRKIPLISFDEVSDPDAGEGYDDDDESYVPSIWDMSVAVDKGEGNVEEDDVSMLVHDIAPAPEEIPLHETVLETVKEVTEKHLEDVFFLVTESCLLQLASFTALQLCTRCGNAVSISQKKKGTAVVLIWSCTQGHTIRSWASQPVLRHGTMFGNIKFLSSITLSGNNYQKIALMCRFINLQIPATSTFTQLQSHFIVPTVQEYWTELKETSQEELRSCDIVIAGDGRMDSPGHSAKYCTYTVMDQATKKILTMEVVDKRECMLVSNRMEAVAFQRALNELKAAGLNIVEVVTDAHPQITSIMKKEHNQVKHSWDIWHGAKNLGKKLCMASQEKGKRGLKPWINSITNHFYYCAENCEKDDLKFSIKFMSILNHCTNRHMWALGQCDHDELEEDPDKPWLDPCGPEIEGLERIITDTRFQGTLKHYVTCRTTSELESFNNHLLMYAAKRQAFTYAVYKCRCQLAAIDYMEHLNRPYKRKANRELYYNRVFSKSANHWSVKPAKVEKKYSYIKRLLLGIFTRYGFGEAKISHRVQQTADDPARISKTIAPVTPPSTKELVELQEPRLKKKAIKPSTSKESD